MKKHFITIIFLGIFPFIGSAQWEFQNPIPTNAHLNDIFFVDNNHGWAVGAYVTILHTSDGGNNWTEQFSGANDPMLTNSVLLSIHFSDLNNGWAAGYKILSDGEDCSALLLHTTNRGNSWNIIAGIDDFCKFCDVHFVNNSTGWVLDENGKILHTPDGGSSWITQYNDTARILNSMSFVDAENGWTSGNDGLILHTSNGGNSWDEQEGGVNINLSGIFFTDSNNGWTVGVGESNTAMILHSQNSGSLWNIIDSVGLVFEVGSMYFNDSLHGWIAARSVPPAGRWGLLATQDGGENWEWQSTGLILDKISSVFFFDEDNGWAIGENVIIKSTDAGESWQMQNTITYFPLSDVCFIDQDNGWAVGAKEVPTFGVIQYENRVLHTIDGGENWFFELRRGGTYYKNIFFSDVNHGWIITVPEPFNETGILTTSDGGINWQSYSYDYYIHTLFFIDSLNGWLTAHHTTIPWPTLGLIYNTTDGGDTWINQYSDSTKHIIGISFVDEHNGWISGRDGLILHTSDGGNSWDEQESGVSIVLSSINFTDQNNGWAVGQLGTILHTTDGGENWLPQENPAIDTYDFLSVSFVDSEHGWVVGNRFQGYIILYTDDGGETWITEESRPYGELSKVQFVDQENGWAVGVCGTILHADNGGITWQEEISEESKELSIKAYPNPTCGISDIRYQVPACRRVSLGMYNIHGQQVSTLVDEKQAEGEYVVRFDGTELPAGIYFFRLIIGSEIESIKLLLINDY